MKKKTKKKATKRTATKPSKKVAKSKQKPAKKATKRAASKPSKKVAKSKQKNGYYVVRVASKPSKKVAKTKRKPAKKATKRTASKPSKKVAKRKPSKKSNQVDTKRLYRETLKMCADVLALLPPIDGDGGGFDAMEVETFNDVMRPLNLKRAHAFYVTFVVRPGDDTSKYKRPDEDDGEENENEIELKETSFIATPQPMANKILRWLVEDEAFIANISAVKLADKNGNDIIRPFYDNEKKRADDSNTFNVRGVGKEKEVSTYRQEKYKAQEIAKDIDYRDRRKDNRARNAERARERRSELKADLAKQADFWGVTPNKFLTQNPNLYKQLQKPSREKVLAQKKRYREKNKAKIAAAQKAYKARKRAEKKQ